VNRNAPVKDLRSFASRAAIRSNNEAATHKSRKTFLRHMGALMVLRPSLEMNRDRAAPFYSHPNWQFPKK
jgi:hypothetical protein